MALFLDRDGVLNVRTPGDYVRTPEMWVPAPGFEKAMPLLAAYFTHIIVVTNQAGIAKGLMTEDDLTTVHDKMLALTAEVGGRIDRIYHCPDLSDSGSTCRKPATGMAWLALTDFPDIDFAQSWMVGDSASDIEFGKTLGMKTVLIEGKPEDEPLLAKNPPDFRFDTLYAFARFVTGS
jgi:D-glycero-D-manno-heptose 1,7-bisphosphate phosphatase